MFVNERVFFLSHLFSSSEGNVLGVLKGGEEWILGCFGVDLFDGAGGVERDAVDSTFRIAWVRWGKDEIGCCLRGLGFLEWGWQQLRRGSEMQRRSRVRLG